MKTRLRKIVYKLPLGKNLWRILAIITLRTVSKPTFSGWNLKIYNQNPWDYELTHPDHKDFIKINQAIKTKISERTIVLSQFESKGLKKIMTIHEELKWRHYIVYWSSLIASTNNKKGNYVEFGVCDGLTISYAIEGTKNQFNYYLYDAWEPMTEKNLLNSEEHLTNRYNNLLIDRTKKNLVNYSNLHYCKGFVPEVFSDFKLPKKIIWCHIDINSALATRDCIIEVFPCLEKGGIILFDDYGQKEFTDTRKIIDAELSKVQGHLLQFPTGQGLFIKQ